MGGSTRSSGPLLGRESWCLPVWWRATHISLLAACSMQLILFSWCQPHPGRALVPNLADACPSRPRQHVSRHSVFQRLTCLLRTDTATHTTPHHTTTNKLENTVTACVWPCLALPCATIVAITQRADRWRQQRGVVLGCCMVRCQLLSPIRPAGRSIDAGYGRSPEGLAVWRRWRACHVVECRDLVVSWMDIVLLPGWRMVVYRGLFCSR
jgi:hypothetical protein